MTLGTPNTPAAAIERAMQVFRFLKAFAERNLPIRRRLDEQLWRLDLWNLPSHPTIELGQVVLTDSEEGNETATEDVAPLLRVRRPKITAAPDPPALIASWVKGGWKHPDGSPEVEVTRTLERDGETISEEFASDSARVFLFNHWKWTWAAWAKSELLARQAMRIFERLYELRGRIERESESVELLVGDGRLRWRTPAGVIDHPIVLQRVELIFDADVPEFRILDADRPPELYVGLLQAAEGLATSKLSDLRGELEKGGYHPLAGPETSAYLRRLAALVHARGKSVE